jgi:hypothetical protein
MRSGNLPGSGYQGGLAGARATVVDGKNDPRPLTAPIPR